MSVTSRQIQEFTARKLARLLDQSADSMLKATLANLRRGVGRTPGEAPQLWGILLGDMPEEMLGQGNSPSRAEWAVYSALTLFAVHQQGRDPHKEPMNQKDHRLGGAVACLVSSEEDQFRVLRRFNAVATSSDIGEAIHHLRGIVQLLRSEGVALNYPALAGDLYQYQFPELVKGVRLSWGRDFYRNLYKNNEDEIGKEDTNE